MEPFPPLLGAWWCDVPRDVVAMRSLEISCVLGDKEFFAVCQGGGQSGEWAAKQISSPSHTGGSRELEKL